MNRRGGHPHHRPTEGPDERPGAARGDDPAARERERGPCGAGPAALRGTVVNSVTGSPVRGVGVTVRHPVTLAVIEDATTNANGAWRVDGLTWDEYGVKFNGSSVGYETGYLGCGRQVVAAWGDACSVGTGRVGKARLDRL